MSDLEEHPTTLLLPFVQGELDEDDTRTVSDHLAECTQCADEERGIRLLTDDPDDGLNDLERARLHHAVIAATGEPAHAPGVPLSRRLAPYLGTAAVLALLAVGVMIVDPLSGDDHDAGLEGSVAESPVDEGTLQEESDEAAFGQGSGQSFFSSGDPAPESARTLAAGATPLFQAAAGRMAAGDLDRLGRSSAPFRAFAKAYRADAAPALQSRTLEQLIRGLPASEADLVRDCAREVLRTSVHAPVPVYGGYGSLDGEEVLLLGFAWTPGTSGHLDRFMVWAWPRGSCESPLVYRWGWIDR